jgi:PucR C-terminal helix-turn-helix domain
VTVRELLGRLSAIDSDAENAVRVIAHFDALIEGRAGLDAFVRAAAMLANCTAGLHHPELRICIRVDSGGNRLQPGDRQMRSPSQCLDANGADVWLERPVDATSRDVMVLERLAAGVNVALDRMYQPMAGCDPDLVELLLDGRADPADRARAAEQAGLSRHAPVRAVASVGSGQALPAEWRKLSTTVATYTASIAAAQAWNIDSPPTTRVGLGQAGPPADLPHSWRSALAALRLTSAGTDGDPGPRFLCYDDLGPVALLSETIPAAAARIEDVVRLDRIGQQLPWALATLEALAEHQSQRRAAAVLYIHHSTMQERVGLLERSLGYSLGSIASRNRLYLTLVLRRLHRNGDMPIRGFC